MARSKKATLRNPGIPPSMRRARPTLPSCSRFGLPISAAVILDVGRIQGVWEEWYRSGVIDRAWDPGVYLGLLPHFLREGLAARNGLESMRPVVLEVLERVKSGEMTPEEFQASIDRSRRDHMEE
jgi:hypothetical protein